MLTHTCGEVAAVIILVKHEHPYRSVVVLVSEELIEKKVFVNYCMAKVLDAT